MHHPAPSGLLLSPFPPACYHLVLMHQGHQFLDLGREPTDGFWESEQESRLALLERSRAFSDSQQVTRGHPIVRKLQHVVQDENEQVQAQHS